MSVSERPETFLTVEQAAEVRERFGTPCYVYDRRTLESVARAALDFLPRLHTLRYAMKANPSIGILTLFRELGAAHRRLQRLRGRAGDPAGFKPSRSS